MIGKVLNPILVILAFLDCEIIGSICIIADCDKLESKLLRGTLNKKIYTYFLFLDLVLKNLPLYKVDFLLNSVDVIFTST